MSLTNKFFRKFLEDAASDIDGPGSFFALLNVHAPLIDIMRFTFSITM